MEQDIGELIIDVPGQDVVIIDNELAQGISATSIIHTHDTRYFTKQELSDSGAGGAVHWDNVTSKPSTYPPASHSLSAHTSALSDVDFAGYKAIAMSCDSGSTLPTSPKTGQWFLHTPTRRKVLMMYDGSAWRPIISFGSMTLCVDGTNGTDDPNKGYRSGTDAFKTVQYAIDQIPPSYTGSITIYVAAGTYSGFTVRGKFPSGDFGITIYGTMSTVATYTITSGTIGSNENHATITVNDANWTPDQWVGYLAYFNGIHRVIRTNTSDTLTLVGYASSTPSGTLEIRQQATIVNSGINIYAPRVSLYYFKVDSAQLLYSGQLCVDSNISYSVLFHNTSAALAITNNGNATISNCYIFTSNQTYGRLINISSGGRIHSFTGFINSIESVGTVGIYVETLGYFYTRGGFVIINNFSTGMVVGASGVAALISSGRNLILNCETGISAAINGSGSYITSYTYFSNCTNTFSDSNTSLSASYITSGTFDPARIPNLDASKITSGVLDMAQIPDLDASKITSGVLDMAQIPDLDASKITSGVLDVARIPDLDASKIASGTLSTDRFSAWQDLIAEGKVLNNDLTIYLSPSGNDTTGNGTQSNPYFSINRAMQDLRGIIANGKGVTIQLANGTYDYNTDQTLITVLGAFDYGQCRIVGNTSSPSSVVINFTDGTYGIYAIGCLSQWQLMGFTIQGSVGQSLISAYNGSIIWVSSLVFDSSSARHMMINFGAKIRTDGDYTIAGGATQHFGIFNGALVEVYQREITITNTPNFSKAFLTMQSGAGFNCRGTTWSGSATGVRYTLNILSWADTAGATLPGDQSGTVSNGSVYT